MELSNFDSYSWVATDDVSGEPLDPKLLMQARREEIKYFKDMRVYEKGQASTRSCTSNGWEWGLQIGVGAPRSSANPEFQRLNAHWECGRVGSWALPPHGK